MAITASDVNKLRVATGAGMMDCKKALEQTDGDFEAAIDFLRKSGQKISSKRSDREANEGVVVAMTTADGTTGIVLKVTSETDFVAKNADFIAFAQTIGELAATTLPSDVDALKAQIIDGISVADKLNEQVAKIGEKIDVVDYHKVEGESVVAYTHSGNRIGVLVALNQPADEKKMLGGKDVAMQIAAMNPVALTKDDVSEDVINRELEIAKELIRAEGKPEEMVEKIAAGKLGKFFKDSTLLAQDFVKDPSRSVEKMLKDIDPGLTVKQFVRVALGA